MQNQSGIILLTVLIYLLLMNILILATHELIQINSKVSQVMQQQQILTNAAEFNIKMIENDIQKNLLPTCMQVGQNANTYYQQPEAKWQNSQYCLQKKDKVNIHYIVELMPKNLCEMTSTGLQAQRYRLTQRAALNQMVSLIQTTGVFASSSPAKTCLQQITLDLGRHSWRG